jgi:Flp pilus assembly protein TadB
VAGSVTLTHPTSERGDSPPIIYNAALTWERIMEFTALFLAVTIVMLVAWWGARPLALALFAVTLIAAIATYLHHASDVLKLSF